MTDGHIELSLMYNLVMVNPLYLIYVVKSTWVKITAEQTQTIKITRVVESDARGMNVLI